ncbi:TonB-dependent receptor plug domain-containing protein [Flavihumibacter sp. ZG627]|uniref:TonB-dependent receptor family protein n=1 Tax=Flavihumibacter sp. ZG627 TaxID=1463156 RepID=UPI000580AE9E|nr:TonB-dependent receptor plug domain-containing protein [Flavihumibacter sp. ZG627]KIC92336.1 hypothetical protein HY58_02015 [Flavihumibacter sp. ZG627]
MKAIKNTAVLLLATCCLATTASMAQEKLDSVTVTAFARRTVIKDAAASVVLVRERDWQRFSPASALPAINRLPGVRMEERSPGSYRLAIRGSSLRSPFGVRNIRMYYNQIPFTDPGGNTYLNQFAVGNFSNIEILKGPGSSLYGAGTGGLLLANTEIADSSNLSLQYMTGSYGLHQVEARATLSSNRAFKHSVYGHHQRSDGYRDHTNMKRTVAAYTGRWQQTAVAALDMVLLYGDLWYQTPGALNRNEFEKDPRQSRPAAGTLPSSVSARAAIDQRTLFGGLHQELKPFSGSSIDISLYGATTSVTNPAVRNYERRKEPHFGGRIVFGYTIPLFPETTDGAENGAKLQFNIGGEWQQGNYSVKVYRNINGEQGELQTDDRLKPRTALLFGQGILDLPRDWQLSAGLSYNANTVEIRRVSEEPAFEFNSNYRKEWMPRVALTKKLGVLTFYSMIAKGFSPPTTSELLPSTSVINTSLQAESGWNYEVGLRGRILKQKLYFDLDFFYYRLRDAIVQRRDASGADYFENAGSTRQKGFEGFFSYGPVVLMPAQSISLSTWMSYTLHPFRYVDYKQVENDFSGNRLPGVAKQTLAAGFDVDGKGGMNLHLAYQYVDPIWLNDANSEKAKQYHLLGIRGGSRLYRGLNWFAGADNLFNTTYSLGNDINAFGGRYYNVAPGRNYYAGLRIQLK